MFGGISVLDLLQNAVTKASELVNAEFGIADENGVVIACSDGSKINSVSQPAREFLSLKSKTGVSGGYTLQKLYIRNRFEYIVFVKGTGEQFEKYLSLLSMNVLNIRQLTDDRSSRINFLKAVLRGGLAAGDIALNSRLYRITPDSERVVYLVKTEPRSESYACDVLQGMFPNKQKDTVFVIEDEKIALIRELAGSAEGEEVYRVAETIADTLNAELMENVFVGIGPVVSNLRDLSRSYAEADLALTIGMIFDSDKRIKKYDDLGIGRLIYKLPEDACNAFLDEVFKDGSFESLDDETMHTIHSFFKNSLNVSETSRQLFVHRNTLVYRLDKIQKLTGLDLRKFDDAVVFKVAMLVKNYIDSRR